MMGVEPGKLEYKKALPLDPAAAQEFVGDYKVAILSKLSITLNQGRMYAQMSFQPAFRVYPSGPDRFFYRQVEAELIFKRDDSGSVVGLELEQGGRTLKASRQ